MSPSGKLICSRGSCFRREVEALHHVPTCMVGKFRAEIQLQVGIRVVPPLWWFCSAGSGEANRYVTSIAAQEEMGFVGPEWDAASYRIVLIAVGGIIVPLKAPNTRIPAQLTRNKAVSNSLGCGSAYKGAYAYKGFYKSAGAHSRLQLSA
ncbi:hypothetical protein BU16DRAFT_535023 [Lophium mytilinum]|uniref:Uncharacterized protein n=1 Tax=Lophium mytilinum TaxID=390894 RepID=A0A6A6R7A7_9PEZI|nr:hypothetical protein BU16DRAFT_535023 [Lophium mytilinum]